MKKSVYILCKIGNWLLPLILTVIAVTLNNEYDYIFCIYLGYILFGILWFMFSTTRSRLLYQSPIFIGYMVFMYNTYASDETIFEEMLNMNVYNATIAEKIIMTAFCIIVFACKIYTMAYETKDYNDDAAWRHNNRLDDKIAAATYELEHARNAVDRQRAEARLERAKLNKERYKRDE